LKTGPVNSFSIKWSCVLHGSLLLFALIAPFLPVFRSKKVIDASDFTVVLEENLVEQNVPTPQVPPTQKAPPPAPVESAPEPDAPPPISIPEPPKDALVIEKKKPKPPEKKIEKKTVEKPVEKPAEKKPEKPPEKKIEKPVEKKFVKGKRVEAPVKVAQPKFESLYKPFDPSKPVSVKPMTDKMLSKGDIEKALRDGARAGTQNIIPEDEISRCVVLVKRAMYDAWDQPGGGDAGSRPTLLDIRLDSTGRLVSYQIRQSSGNAYFDQTVLKAAAHVTQIRGLTLAFLKQYETLTVEFKLE